MRDPESSPVVSRPPTASLRAGLVLAAALALLSTLGAWLYGVSPRRQLDPLVAAQRGPGSRLVSVRLADGRELAAEKVVRAGEVLRLEGRPGIEEVPLAELAGDVDEAVSADYFPLGTDRFGRDLLARLLYGGRLSLAVALLAVALTLAVGVPFGLAAGLAGPRLDRVALSTIEAVQAFPRLFLLVALAAVSPTGIVPVVLLIGLTGWMPVARLVRAEVRTLRGRDFVLAARVSGAGPWRVAFRHVLPNALAPVAIEGSLGVAAAIVTEATLSFLGLGVPPPTPSWGGMIADGRDALASAWWVALFPGIALALAALAFNLLGEGLRDRLDPRRRRLEI